MSDAKRGGMLRFFSASILIQGVLPAANRDHLLLGETCNVIGKIGLCILETRRYPSAGSVGAGPVDAG
jgi:hypothetical protein